MPASIRTESIVRSLRRTPVKRRVEVDPWEPVPVSQRLDWCRALSDFPPRFVGVAVMGAMAQTVGQGRIVASPDFIEQAVAFHRLGFAPADWYTLRLCVEVGLPQIQGRGGGRFIRTAEFRGVVTHALVPADWSGWLALRRTGLTPMAAVDAVLRGDAAPSPDRRLVHARHGATDPRLFVIGAG